MGQTIPHFHNGKIFAIARYWIAGEFVGGEPIVGTFGLGDIVVIFIVTQIDRIDQFQGIIERTNFHLLSDFRFISNPRINAMQASAFAAWLPPRSATE